MGCQSQEEHLTSWQRECRSLQLGGDLLRGKEGEKGKGGICRQAHMHAWVFMGVGKEKGIGYGSGIKNFSISNCTLDVKYSISPLTSG